MHECEYPSLVSGNIDINIENTKTVASASSATRIFLPFQIFLYTIIYVFLFSLFILSEFSSLKMVKLYALSVLYKGPHKASELKTAYELSSFSFFQRTTVQQFMAVFCQTIVERTFPASRQSVKENDYLCHVYVRADKLAGVLISDHEYPHRVAHTLLTKVLDEFAVQVPPTLWTTATDATVSFPQLNSYLTKYQNPREADPMTKIQEELDETKIILHNTLEAVLERGEKLDDLVAKSEGLSLQSKAFYKTARKTNSCCSLG